jgi:hypothetical protein
MMASADKTAKPKPAPKKEEAAPKVESTPSAASPKAESSDAAAAPSANYSRGEGQKPVSQAYKDNWNAIYGKKKKR